MTYHQEKYTKREKTPQKIQSKKNKNKHHGKILQKKITGKYKIKHIIINIELSKNTVDVINPAITRHLSQCHHIEYNHRTESSLVHDSSSSIPILTYLMYISC